MAKLVFFGENHASPKLSGIGAKLKAVSRDFQAVSVIAEGPFLSFGERRALLGGTPKTPSEVLAIHLSRSEPYSNPATYSSFQDEFVSMRGLGFLKGSISPAEPFPIFMLIKLAKDDSLDFETLGAYAATLRKMHTNLRKWTGKSSRQALLEVELIGSIVRFMDAILLSDRQRKSAPDQGLYADNRLAPDEWQAISKMRSDLHAESVARKLAACQGENALVSLISGSNHTWQVVQRLREQHPRLYCDSNPSVYLVDGIYAGEMLRADPEIKIASL